MGKAGAFCSPGWCTVNIFGLLPTCIAGGCAGMTTTTTIPTPWHLHVGPQGPFREVYEPAEDTFLLLDALEKDAAELRDARWGAWLIEGCVCGYHPTFYRLHVIRLFLTCSIYTRRGSTHTNREPLQKEKAYSIILALYLRRCGTFPEQIAF